MIKPPEYDEFINKPITQAEKDEFLAEQFIMRDMIWCAKHRDLFGQVGLFNGQN